MKTSLWSSVLGADERTRRLRRHAAPTQLPIYQAERLAYTDAANLLAANPGAATKARPSRFEVHYRWLRLRLRTSPSALL